MITVLGAAGFIGSNLVHRLAETGGEYFAPARDENLGGKNLGQVIYCIGLSSDFRQKPFETVQAHVCRLLETLQTCEYESLLYLSSTRVYGERLGSASETDRLWVDPAEPEDLYNISKLMGESLALSVSSRNRVVRLSNVYGADWGSRNFLSAVIQDAVRDKSIRLQTSLDSEKDYVKVDDAVDLLIRIATAGKERVYNVASGKNYSNSQLTQRIRELTGCRLTVESGAPKKAFPSIDVKRITNEFAFHPADIMEDLPALIESCRLQMR